MVLKYLSKKWDSPLTSQRSQRILVVDIPISAITLYLYTAPECKLCTYAKTVIGQSRCQLSKVFNLQEVDITQQFDLKKRYGWHIPVLGCSSTNEELNWPFDIEQCTSYIQNYCE